MKWLKSNFITLLLIFVSVVVAWESLSFQVDAISEQVSKYPSADYFDLKFKILEDNLASVNEKLDRHLEKD